MTVLLDTLVEGWYFTAFNTPHGIHKFKIYILALSYNGSGENCISSEGNKTLESNVLHYDYFYGENGAIYYNCISWSARRDADCRNYLVTTNCFEGLSQSYGSNIIDTLFVIENMRMYLRFPRVVLWNLHRVHTIVNRENLYFIDFRLVY